MTQLKQTSKLAEGESTDIDPHVEFQSHLPYMGVNLNELTTQQETYVLSRAGGMTVAAAGRAAGYQDRAAYEVEKRDAVQKAIQYFREQNRREVQFDLVDAHNMYLSAYRASANATEMKNTTDSLVKLHGIAKEETKPLVNIQINGSKQLERMTDEELLELAGKTIDHLEPKAD